MFFFFSIIDAAELDAVDDFLVTMVDLSFLEDKEEMTRTNYGACLQKRWEARVSPVLITTKSFLQV